MELIETPWQLLSAFFMFICGAAIALAIRKRFQATQARVLLLYAWHSLWCMAYLWYSLNNVADATLYYDVAKRGDLTFAPGTDFVNFLTGILVEYLGLSYLGAFLFFNILGSVGLIAFDGCLRTATRDKARFWRRLATLIIFLPSVSFWSSAIGKDAISFMAACLALWATLDLGRNYRLMAVSIIAMLLVRPHIAGLMVFGIVTSSLLQSRLSVSKKIFFVVSSIAAATALTPFALQYSGITDSSVDGVLDYMQQREGYNMEGGGAVDISSLSLPLKIVTYLFRPFPFEAHSISALAASLDNMVLLFLFAAGMAQAFKRSSRSLLMRHSFAWSYSLLALLVLAMTTANLGIAVRQKWMFLPMLIFLLLFIAGSRRIKDVPVRAVAFRL